MSEPVYEGIAIIGMAGRFPGADSVEEFWANLLAGKDSVSIFSDEDLAESGLDAEALRRRGKYVPTRGVLKDADCFDAAFFSIHPKEAEVMDPQQRVFLEACWTALERSGYAPNQVPVSAGVFAGVSYNTYYQYALQPRPELIEKVGSDLVMFGNERDYLTTRVAYRLGLKGPAVNVSTACSTSMVAVCQACQALLTYQCDMALAGGASVLVPQKRGHFYDEGSIGSPDGHTRTFDEKAAGTVCSNGVGVVVLKRLEDAVKDGDQIYAVIKGAALNNDGSTRVSFGAPGVEGQSQVIAMAHAMSGIDPETISYVEAHGTATPLGDPIEIAGLTKAFRMSTEAKQFCAIGSVKTNVGHLDVAAGVTGLIKTALSLHHKVIPASLHFTKPNPKLDLENSPFFVNAALRDWTTVNGLPRRAGISSFGIGGTNAHLVLEEAPELPTSGPTRSCQLLMLSAKTPERLEEASKNLSVHLQQMAERNASAEALGDAAFTLQSGRSEFVHRRVVACRDAADGAAALEPKDAKRVFTHHLQTKDAPVVFMFPGQGAQYAGMGAKLYQSEPVFRAEVDRCAELLQPIIGADLRKVMFPISGSEPDAELLLVQTRYTQPALFTIEYALARLWMSWGIQPSAMIGHSVGEYVAGCLSGVFQLEDALTLVARRAELVQSQPGGAMLAVRMKESDVQPLLNGHLSIAAINSPNLCVVSGPHESIAEIEKDLAARGVAARHLNTSHAFHSEMMDPVLEPFTKLFDRIPLSEPLIPFVSNVTAQWITGAEAKTPEYWAGHLRQTVRFADGVAELMKDSRAVLLEVGPGHTLTTLARQHPAKSAEQAVLSSLPVAGANEYRGVLETLGRLWMHGATVDWQSYYSNEQRQRVVLPTYPFERKRYWPEGAVKAQPVAAAAQTIEISAAAVAPVYAPVPQAVAAPEIPRKQRLLSEVQSLLHELSGYDVAGADPSVGLLELGLDSLLLTQASQLFQRKFGVTISFRQLMEDLNSPDAIASRLDSVLPPDPPAAAPVAVTVAVPSAVPAAMPANATLEQLLMQQAQLTNTLLQMLSGKTAIPAPAVAAPAAPVLKIESKSSHGPFRPLDRAAGLALTEKQRAGIDALIARYTKRSPGSKKLAAENRALLADPRSAAGFKQLWKEMVYPIVTTRSDGSKVWDVDGNEYIDFVMGFGACMFGHRAPFVVKAVHEQTDLGFEIGPIQPLAGEVATLMREFTGMQRFGFTNTGSEAVLAATRVARTVTGRDKIAVFAGAYHGIFDEVLFRPVTVNGETRTAPIAPGIPKSALEQVIVLDYGNPQSIEILRARGSEIAAVLVEPVQTRRLDLVPKEFMHDLRRVTQETGTALIFDEVVSGFRVHPGGAQAYFGVRADLATYGKVVGGGLPIGVVAGDPKYMDALDGGQWQYGDTSFPEVGVTFFAGTFVRHPLALAAAKAVLLHLKENGPEMQQRLNERTAKLADELRAVVEEFQAPFQVTQFSSIMQFGYPAEHKLAGLLFFLLRERGIHIWENRSIVLTTAHSDDDLKRVVRVFRECLAEMRSAELIPATAGSSATPVQSVSTVPATVSKAEHYGTFPLTEAQKEIWLAAQMGGDAVLAYNESLKLDFHGAFDVELFRTAAAKIVERHPILLASISPDGQTQTVNADTKLDLPLADFSHLSESARQREFTAAVEREVAEPLDLAAGPLLRVRIVRLTSDHHMVLWTAHHIVCDGWSGGLIVSDLAKIYTALKQGAAPELDVPASFREYAMTAQIETPEARNTLDHWRSKFATLPPPLDLPSDRVRPVARSAQAATIVRCFDASLTQSIKQTAGKQKTTQVVLLMAAMKILLHRLAGASDIVFGLPVAGQSMTGSTCLVGHCVNLVPIRTELQPEASFQENVALVKKNVLDAYDHHHCTIGKILQHIQIPRSPSRPPLLEVVFNVDRDASGTVFQGLEFTCERNSKRALHYDLFFNFVEGTRGLRLECDYNTDLFNATTINRWLTHFETLLEGIRINPSEALSKLPMLTAAERIQLIQDWNNTAQDFPKHSLAELFEQQVVRTPDAVALTFDGLDLTYSQLNRSANRLANSLKKQGVGPEVLVGVFLRRSPEMLIAILGVLKAGGAYVPMDPDYPKERLGYILQDSGAPIVLTQSSIAADLPNSSARHICLDTDWNQIAKESEANLASEVKPSNLAYVLFTSGSTGRPKGVAIEHHSATTFVHWAAHVFTPKELSGVLFSTSVCFDLSVYEMFVTLSLGGKVIIAPNALHLPSLPAKNEVTLINTVPSAIAELLHIGGVPDSVRVVNLAGEALSDALVEQIYANTKVEKVYNLYGPTEDTTYSTFTLVPEGCPVTIGKPLSNTQAYILDKHRNPVPIGVPGELLLAGEGLARGYYGRPDLTSERFLSNPFAADSRVYRTGDLCKWLPNGTIQYLGRMDNQVKLRGFRIELGEIEATLDRHPEVRQSLVMAREDQSGEKRLVAYVVPESGKSPQAADLSQHVRQSLPEFMVPSYVMVLDAFPLTPNGKIDRKLLPMPQDWSIESKRAFVAPRNAVERMLAKLWAKVLKLNRVGMNDDFFELGGHSLLAVRIIAEIEKHYKTRLPLATLLKTPTIAGLALLLKKDTPKNAWTALVPLRSEGSKPPLFLMHSHGGNVLEYHHLTNCLDLDQPVYALQAHGLDGQIPENPSLEAMATAYIAEIRNLQPEGPYFLGGYCFGGVLALEAAQQLSDAGQEVALVAMIQSIHPPSARFKPDATLMHQWWYRGKTRVGMELDTLKYRGSGYLKDRAMRALDVTGARFILGVDKLLGHDRNKSRMTTTYILESLGDAHDKAYLRYQPRPYRGKVLLLRASNQLPGLIADDKSLGWAPLLEHLEVCEIPGYQQNLLAEPNVSIVAKKLSGPLGAAQML